LEGSTGKEIFRQASKNGGFAGALKLCRILNVETSMSRSSQQKRKKFTVLGMFVLFSKVNSCHVKTVPAAVMET
jgi:hypothetical protein